ncbi:uncharacterized protein LOC143122170 isoform X3 [Alosa pseudoharengus]|uniref:uncharacterized protein LOC143122170 isoform X3 n=1 Tax=Alosa pseudoharengus TaxID=34774 RepID=UPI003F89875D
MSRYPEPSQQQPMPVKKEVKSEECYEFLQKVKVEETPGLEHGCKTEILAFQTFIVKEEKWSPVRIKEEEESNIREYGHSDFCPDSQKVEERPELEPDWTTDMPTSPQMTCKEETYCTVEIKEEMKEETYCTVEIKEELKEVDGREDLSFTIQEEKPGIEYDCNAEMYTSPQLTCKEEIKADTYVPEEIKEEEIEEENVREYGHGSSPIREAQGDTEETRNQESHPTLDHYVTAQCSVTSSQQFHQRSDPVQKKHECSQCLKTFAGPSPLAYHQRIHTGEKPHRCTTCGKSFRSRLQLAIHQVTHTGERPHRCAECGKAFGQVSHLKAHQMIHTGERPHQCPECGKAFRQMSDLKKHLRFHTGEKPHRCSQCGRAFTQISCLRTHQRTHAGVKPHRCPECGKTFCEISGLKKHQIVHTEEKPYSCALCGKSFRRNADLKTHQLVHSNDKPHMCSLCGKEFSQRVNLTRHQLQIHQRSNTGDKTRRKCSQ